MIGFSLILLTLFAFVPLNNLIVNDSLVVFQTTEEYKTANFMIEKYNFDIYSSIFSHTNTYAYLLANTYGKAALYSDTYSGFQYSDIPTYNVIIYSVSLAKYLQAINVSADQASQLIMANSNIVYNSGFSYIAENPAKST